MAKKAPAFQFYPGDWFREPGLKLVDLNVRGAWAELLMVMWDQNPRGVIETHIDGLAKLWRISHQETCFIVDELNKNKIADVKYFDEDCQKCIEGTSGTFQGISDDVPVCPRNVPKMSPFKFIFVTIINRRMLNEWKVKEYERLRKQKQRVKKTVPEKSKKCPGDVPPSRARLSSSSSSSSKKKKIKDPAFADFFKNPFHPYFKSIETTCTALSKKPPKGKKPFNPFQFVNRKINKMNMHPGAVDYTVKELLKRYDEIEDFYGYGKRILKTANGNFCEKDHIEDHERVKKDFAEYVNGSPELKAMIGKIGDRI